jgi:Poxvirus Late Transcription Factor VLTF3 like
LPGAIAPKQTGVEKTISTMSSFSLNELLQPIANPDEVESEVVVDKLTTLEGFHNDRIKKFQEQKNSLPELKEELLALQARLKNWKIDLRFTDEHKECLERETDLIKKIQAIDSDKDQMNYYLNVGDILFGYYDTQQRIAVGDNTFSAESNKLRTPANSVLSYFKSSEVAVTTDKKKKRAAKATNKASDVSVEVDGLRRDKALEKYLSIIEPSAIKSGIMPGSGIESDYGCCPVCESEMHFAQNEAMLGCPECGHQDFILVDSEKPSYKDPPREISYFAYKKINHLNEWLAQFQAKETTEIPQEIFELIQTELKKERITDTLKLKPSKLREILKKLKLSKYYEHVAHIMNRLNGVQAPVLSREVEDKLRFMFREIQPSFINHCPKGRSNFLSYSYVLYKFCQLLELDEFLPCFPLLKSREKLYMQDKIWQNICDDMGWEFIKSI